MNTIFSKSLLFSMTAVISLSFQCKKDEPVCTMEFRTVSIKVIGEPLDDFYTIRNSNGDTLRFEQYMSEGGYYVVLDDSFHQAIKNSTENFTAVGVINGSKVLEEVFVIKADACHVDKVSGAEEVVI